MDDAELVTVEELVSTFGNNLLLPTWMPPSIELKKIYIFLNKSHAILCYSDRELEDYRGADLTIQLMKSPSQEGLYPEDMMRHANATEGVEFVQIGDISAEVSDVGKGIIYFWYKKVYYIIGGDASHYSKEELIKIVENMKEASELTT